MTLGAMEEAELAREAEPCVEALRSATMQHHAAERSLAAEDPHGAIAAGKAALKQLDRCRPHAQVCMHDGLT